MPSEDQPKSRRTVDVNHSFSVFVCLGALLGIALLGYAAILFRVESNPLVDQIETILPGGQCGQWVKRVADKQLKKWWQVNSIRMRCPPGGSNLQCQFTEMLGVSIDVADQDKPLVAYIAESQCTSGVTAAIKRAHLMPLSVLQNNCIPLSRMCTGCQLCQKACSQGCLSMVEVQPDAASWYWPKPTLPVAV